MRKVRLGVLLALLAATLAYAAIRGPWSASDRPAGPAVPLEAFASTWTKRPVVLVGVGDSVTRGFGARPGYTYFDRLARNPSDEFADMRERCLERVIPSLALRNIAVNGSTSDQHVRHIDALPREPADTLGIVVLTTGGNDLIHWYGNSPPRECAMYGSTMEQAKPWIEAFEARVDAMLTALESKFPGGVHIFIATIYDPTDGRGDIEAAGFPAWRDGLAIHAAYNDAIRKAASRHVVAHVVDMHKLFLGHGLREQDRWYYSNVEDPNERGYDAIRRLMLNEMIKVVPERTR